MQWRNSRDRYGLTATALHWLAALAVFAREHAELPTLAYTHFQPAQPTTVGKRATLWIQDFLLDLEEVVRRDPREERGSPGKKGPRS